MNKRYIVGMILLLAVLVTAFFVWKIFQKPQETKKPFYLSPHVIPTVKPTQTRLVRLPKHNISFQIPNYLKTFQESDPKQRDDYLFPNEVRFYDGISGEDHMSEYQNTGVKVIYSITEGVSHNIENIPFGDAFNGAGKTIRLDSNELAKENALISSDAITIYRYLIGDDLGHNRGKLGMAYQGDILFNIRTQDTVYKTIGINFTCFDHSSKASRSQKCEAILKTFLQTLHISSATILPMPVSYSDKNNYFDLLEFKKKQFDPAKNIISDNEPISYFTKETHAELLQSDKLLAVMRCMPEQIFAHRQDIPYSILPSDRLPYKPVNIIDQNLLQLGDILEKKMPEGYTLSQFIACQTDDNRYIIKYNAIEEELAYEGWRRDSKIIVSFAQVSPNGYIQDIAHFPLPELFTYCKTPLALTRNNMFYFECTIPFPMPDIMLRSYIYRIDLSARKYNLISTCDYYQNKPLRSCK